MKIALDAMGGDNAPGIPVQGALAALDEFGSELSVVLVGPDDLVRQELTGLGRADDPRIEIVHASEVISMSDKAGKAVRDKRDSSLFRAVELHRDGRADAVVSAGHTGAQMAASYMILGLIEGVRRPTIGSMFPVGGGHFTILLDVGANLDCKPANLLQFAVMGSVFMEIMTGTTNPRVGLLSIGEETTKGNELVLASHYLLAESGLNFVGNIEGGDILSGKSDVLVCDGFVGNIVLKLAESMGLLLVNSLKGLVTADPKLAENVKQIRRDYDYSEIGGVPLLGVNGISIICHGRSSPKAIKNAIREAMMLCRGNLPAALAKGVSKYEVSMLARGKARWKSFHDKHDEFEIGNEDDD
jgi:phosphate acyltransferase